MPTKQDVGSPACKISGWLLTGAKRFASTPWEGGYRLLNCVRWLDRPRFFRFAGKTHRGKAPTFAPGIWHRWADTPGNLRRSDRALSDSFVPICSPLSIPGSAKLGIRSRGLFRGRPSRLICRTGPTGPHSNPPRRNLLNPIPSVGWAISQTTPGP